MIRPLVSITGAILPLLVSASTTFTGVAAGNGSARLPADQYACVARPLAFARGFVSSTMSKLSLSLHSPQDWPELLSPSEVAGMLRMAQTTISRWCENGSIEAVRMGRVWRIPREAVWPMVPPSIRAGWPDGPWKEQQQAGD